MPRAQRFTRDGLRKARTPVPLVELTYKGNNVLSGILSQALHHELGETSVSREADDKESDGNVIRLAPGLPHRLLDLRLAVSSGICSQILFARRVEWFERGVAISFLARLTPRSTMLTPRNFLIAPRALFNQIREVSY